jgi:hypothetical protein
MSRSWGTTVMNDLSLKKTKLDKVMDPEQFNQVIDAILQGKYSWACVLILRFAGYNPLHFIPYRTYNRLIKDHCSSGKASSRSEKSLTKAAEPACEHHISQQSLSQIKDLDYQEVVNEQSKCFYGGSNQDNWFSRQFQEHSLSKIRIDQKNLISVSFGESLQSWYLISDF